VIFDKSVVGPRLFSAGHIYVKGKHNSANTPQSMPVYLVEATGCALNYYGIRVRIYLAARLKTSLREED
jgi:hypothetical protein